MAYMGTAGLTNKSAAVPSASGGTLFSCRLGTEQTAECTTGSYRGRERTRRCAKSSALSPGKRLQMSNTTRSACYAFPAITRDRKPSLRT